MGKTYRCTIDVRGYELDSFGHVNHAVYLNYLEHARWKMLEEERITLAEFSAWKRWPVIHSIEAKYLKPTFLGDVLEILSEVIDHGRTTLVWEQTVMREGVPVFKGRVRGVMVDEQGKPAAPPADMDRLWQE